MLRRQFLRVAGGASAAALGGCAAQGVAPSTTAPFDDTAMLRSGPVTFESTTVLHPVRARPNRVFKVTVCTRPFRAAGPRIEAERVRDKLVVHNYGHGGSGWSLSWGSAALAVRLALTDGARDVAVIGCGALGLTAAVTAQRAGARVTIYAKEFPPDVRSSSATGVWSPDSRFALAANMTPALEQRWAAMCRTSYAVHQSYLGVAGTPVEWIDRYVLSDAAAAAPQETPSGAPDFAAGLLRLTPELRRLAWEELEPGTHPFPVPRVRRDMGLVFNVASLTRTLLGEFAAAGGHQVRQEFRTPADLARLRQKVIIDCTGYGARALWRDESVVPVRGQLAWLLPQPEARYCLYYRDVGMVSRSDGIILQHDSEAMGFNDASTEPDPSEVAYCVQSIADLMARMQRG
jgi:D-amino-acid oxidase